MINDEKVRECILTMRENNQWNIQNPKKKKRQLLENNYINLMGEYFFYKRFEKEQRISNCHLTNKIGRDFTCEQIKPEFEHLGDVELKTTTKEFQIPKAMPAEFVGDDTLRAETLVIISLYPLLFNNFVKIRVLPRSFVGNENIKREVHFKWKFQKRAWTTDEIEERQVKFDGL